MRVKESILISAPREVVWEYITEPANYLHFMAGVTRWEVESEERSGLGARYRMLMRVGSAEVGGLVEVVEFSECRDMAWSSITGIDQRGRWRVREAGQGLTRVEFRFAYGVAGAGLAGYLSERLAKPTLSRHIRRSLTQLKREIEHERLRADAASRRRTREQASA